MHVCCPPQAKDTIMLSNFITILILVLSMSSADPEEHCCSNHRDGHTDYTFVVDNLVWLTFIVLMIILLAWACCTVYPNQPPMQQQY